MSLCIVGLGHYLPPRRVANQELAALCGRSPEWIESRTGVVERRWVGEESSSFMAAQAAREAVQRAGVAWSDIDLIINASGTPAQALPDGATLLQRELLPELHGVPGFSIHATCLSFLVGLQVADSLLARHTYRHILLVSSEIASGALNFQQPESAALFGDGAAAAVLASTPAGQPSRLLAFRLETFSEGVYLTEVRGGGSRHHPSRCRPEDNLFSMDGPAVLRLARTHLPPFLERLSPGLSHGLPEVDLVIPHQASKAGLTLLKRFGWPQQRIATTLSHLGNTVAASIPLTLYQAVQIGQVPRGTRLLLLGTGAGFSIGGALLVY